MYSVVRSPKFILAPVYSCTHWLRSQSTWLRSRNSPPPAFGLVYEGATEAVDMNGRFQMQGDKNWILPK